MVSLKGGDVASIYQYLVAALAAPITRPEDDAGKHDYNRQRADDDAFYAHRPITPLL
jgi:hypothetical protein